MAEETKKVASKKPAAAKTTTATKKAPVKKATPKAEVKEEVKVEAKPVAKKVSKGAVKAKETNRLKEKYNTVVKQHLMDKYHYTSIMEVPHVEKVVINIGVGDAVENAKLLEDSVRELGIIAGQHPVTTKAKKSIANYKSRQGQEIGCKVTLRGIRMYEFLDKLISISLPRVRDFRGVNKNAFDGRGSYTLGVKEQLIFPEIDYDKVNKIRGMDVTIVTTANTDEEAYTLLEELGMPFHK